MRHVTTSKLPSAKGRSSERAITSGCIPGAGSTVTTAQPASLLGIRPVQANDDRQIDLDPLERGENSPRDLVAARDPAEDVEEDRAHLRIARDHLERVDDSLRGSAAAKVAEVRWPTTGDDDDVDRGHRQARAVAENPNLAVELHVGHTLFAREGLERIRGFDVSHLRDVRMTEERAVVDGELRVERFYLTLGRDDQRIDLAQHRVGLDEAAVELLDDRRDLLLFARIVDGGGVDQPARLVWLEALERIDVQTCERFGSLGRDLPDPDPPFLREHEERSF